MRAIAEAAKVYNVPTEIMTAIAIVETGAGKFTTTRKNKNGTYDKGLFQINTVNKQACIAYNLYTPEGSAMCAAKLLAALKRTRPFDYYAAYHSKTVSLKNVYKNKVDKILNNSKLLLSNKE
jgi:membrane-bound lytic murein transglycosylase B